jgi:hypothetical protein
MNFSSLLQQVLSRPRISNNDKIRSYIVNFMLASSLTKNKEYSKNLRDFVDELIKEQKFETNDLNPIYKQISDMLDANLVSALYNLKHLLVMKLSDHLGEENSDVVDRFNFNELKDIFHNLLEYYLTDNVKLYISKITNLLKPTKDLATIFVSININLKNMSPRLEKLYDAERSKILDIIILDDFTRSTLENEIVPTTNEIFNSMYENVVSLLVKK